MKKAEKPVKIHRLKITRDPEKLGSVTTPCPYGRLNDVGSGLIYVGSNACQRCPDCVQVSKGFVRCKGKIETVKQ